MRGRYLLAALVLVVIAILEFEVRFSLPLPSFFNYSASIWVPALLIIAAFELVLESLKKNKNENLNARKIVHRPRRIGKSAVKEK